MPTPHEVFPVIPTGTRLKGINLSFRSEDKPNQVAFGGLWGSSNSIGWVLADLTKQVDYGLVQGCNYVRVMGDVQERIGGFLSDSDYAGHIRAFLDYCRSKHLFVHWCMAASQQLWDKREAPSTPIIPTADILAKFALDAAVLADYLDIVFAIDPLQEIVSVSNSGQTAQDTISEGAMYALIEDTYTSLKSALPTISIACSGMQVSFVSAEGMFSDFSILEGAEGFWDHVDFHVYSAAASEAQLEALASAFPGKGLIVGETGQNLDASKGPTAATAALFLHSQNCLGGAIWSAIDYVDADPGEQWGTNNGDGSIRTKGEEWRDQVTGFEATESFYNLVETYARAFSGNQSPPIGDGWSDLAEPSVWRIASSFLTANTSGGVILYRPQRFDLCSGQKIAVTLDSTVDASTKLILAVGTTSDFGSTYTADINLTTGQFFLYANDPSIGGGFQELQTGFLFSPDGSSAYTLEFSRIVTGNTSALTLTARIGNSQQGTTGYSDNRVEMAGTDRGVAIASNQSVNSSARLRISSVAIDERGTDEPVIDSLVIPSSGAYVAIAPNVPLLGSDGFWLKVNGSSASIVSVIPVAGVLRLYPATPFESGDAVTVSYDDAAGTYQNLAGVPLESFAGAAVTNNTTASGNALTARLCMGMGMGLCFGAIVASGESEPIPDPPVNDVAPVLSNTVGIVGTIISCDSGMWANDPTSYAFAWTFNSSPAGVTINTIDTTAFGVGFYQCQVTATNSGGSASALSDIAEITDNP